MKHFGLLASLISLMCFISCSKEGDDLLSGTDWWSVDSPTNTISFSKRKCFMYYNNSLGDTADYSLNGDIVSFNSGEGIIRYKSGDFALVITHGVLNESLSELYLYSEEKRDGFVINSFSLTYKKGAADEEGPHFIHQNISDGISRNDKTKSFD